MKRGGRVPFHASRRHKSLLPTAAVQLLTDALKIVKSDMNDDERRLNLELTVRHAVSEQDRLGNDSRLYTIPFKYDLNGHYYIGLNRRAFGKFICKWVGSISDCNVLHVKSLQEMFEPFF